MWREGSLKQGSDPLSIGINPVFEQEQEAVSNRKAVDAVVLEKTANKEAVVRKKGEVDCVARTRDTLEQRKTDRLVLEMIMEHKQKYNSCRKQGNNKK